MNVDKWDWCCQFLLINGPGTVIVLYWASDESCYCIIVHVGFWIELPVQRRLCLIFVKLWIPVNGTQQCGIKFVKPVKKFNFSEKGQNSNLPL